MRQSSAIKLQSLFLVVCIAFSACSKSSKITTVTPPVTGPYDVSSSIMHDGISRTYTVHLPKIYYNSTAGVPLVLALHGGGGDASSFAALTLLNNKSDSAGFIVVYPEGILTANTGQRTWNAGECCGTNDDYNTKTDDVGFISDLIDTLEKKYHVNGKKVYATGHSNGAMMCYRLANEIPGKLAAIAANSGAFQMMQPYRPSRIVPVLHIHSILDTTALYPGGQSKVIPGLFNKPVDSCLNVVANFSGCTDGKHTVSTFPLYTIYTWTNACATPQFQVMLYLTNDGGHSWPGGTQGTGLNADPPSRAFQNDYVIWNFLKGFSLP